MVWQAYGPPGSSNIGSKLSRTERFDENRLRFAKPVFFMSELFVAALTAVNHMETIP
jgi:hypothetical protein